MITPEDHKWIRALEDIYPYAGATLPYFEGPDGTVNAVKTLTCVLQLVGMKFGPGGRILLQSGLQPSQDDQQALLNKNWTAPVDH
jgi:hypothetical protein